MPKSSTDWRSLVETAITEDAPKIITTGIRLDGPSNAVIRRAARKRGMSPAAYMRRASVAFALHDLGQSEQWARVHADEPGFTAYGVPMGKAPYRPNGHGFGNWIIVKLKAAFDGE